MASESGRNARDALMEAAERLFAERGLDHVSTREILDAAGQKNQSALQYHFGDRNGLLWAIFDRRMVTVEARRKAILRNAPAPGVEPATLLIEALIRPLVEASMEPDGGHFFLKLAMQSAYRPDTDMLEIIDSGRFPVVKEISSRIDLHLAHLPEEERPIRKRLVVEGCVGAVWIWAQSAYRDAHMETFIRTSVAMGVSCMQLESQILADVTSSLRVVE